MSHITVDENILPQMLDEIRQGRQRVLDGAGLRFHKVAYAECPRSNINTPGYVHLQDTIGYEVDQQSTFYQQWATFYAVKSYAQFVNDGTSRMPPRPFFDHGILAVQDDMDVIVEGAYRDLMLGRVGGRK